MWHDCTINMVFSIWLSIWLSQPKWLTFNMANTCWLLDHEMQRIWGGDPMAVVSTEVWGGRTQREEHVVAWLQVTQHNTLFPVEKRGYCRAIPLRVLLFFTFVLAVPSTMNWCRWTYLVSGNVWQSEWMLNHLLIWLKLYWSLLWPTVKEVWAHLMSLAYCMIVWLYE